MEAAKRESFYRNSVGLWKEVEKLKNHTTNLKNENIHLNQQLVSLQ